MVAMLVGYKTADNVTDAVINGALYLLKVNTRLHGKHLVTIFGNKEVTVAVGG